MPILELKSLPKNLTRGVRWFKLKPTDFQLEAGQFVAIIGPSGSGKTTFLTLLGHLETPSKDRFSFAWECQLKGRNEQLCVSMISASLQASISFLF